MLTASYGTYVGAEPSAGAELRAEIRAAEQAGYEAVYFSEHHGTPNYPASPLTLAGYALGLTTTLRSGPMPLLLPLHNPVRVAEETALLDHISGGRLSFGFAPGYLRADFDQTTLPFPERGRRCDEAMEIVTRLWRGEPQEFSGEFTTVHGNRPLTHLPVAGSGPQLWTASASPAGMRRAIRWSAGLVIDSVRPRTEVEDLVRRYEAICADGGVPPRPVAVIRRCWFGTPDEVDGFRRRYAAELANYMSMIGDSDGPGARSVRTSHDQDEAVSARVVAGLPEQVADELTDWASSHGIAHVIIKMHWGQPDHEQIMQQLGRSARFIARLAANS